MRQSKGLNISKHDANCSGVKWHRLGAQMCSCFPNPVCFQHYSWIDSCLALQPGQEALCCSSRGIGLCPFPCWCGMSVITLSVVEGTSVLSLGQILDCLLGAVRPAGGGDPMSQPDSAPWRSLSSCHLSPARRYLSGSRGRQCLSHQGFLECCRDEVTLQDFMGST